MNPPTDPPQQGSGSAFLRCSDGQIRWGLFGAAGVLFVHLGNGSDHDSGPVSVQLQKRSAFAHQGGSWSCAGGAIEAGEDALTAGLREATEEVGAVPQPIIVHGTYEFRPASDWSYITSVIEVPERFGTSLNFETDAVEWFATSEVADHPLHPGFAAAWPHLLAMIESKMPNPTLVVPPSENQT